MLRSAGGDRIGPMEGHCLRCYCLSLDVADRNGWALDEEVVLVAAILHDVGLYGDVTEGGVYVKEGAELAEKLLAGHGWSEERIRLCADAIECHHELRKQLDRGFEVEALRRADLIEVSQTAILFGVPRDWVRELRRQVPPKGFTREVNRLVGRALLKRPATVPRIFWR